MDRPAVPAQPGEDHWAPEHLVIAREVLTYAGRLRAERDEDGEVLTRQPLAGMAAVEQRHPAWALGPFGRVEPDRALPDAPGVYALVQGGEVRYVGASANLARTFGPRGIGHISRRDAQRARNEERCRLNRRVVDEAVAGRDVDVYVIVVEGPRLRPWSGGRGARAAELAARLADATRGAWHPPT